MVTAPNGSILINSESELLNVITFGQMATENIIRLFLHSYISNLSFYGSFAYYHLVNVLIYLFNFSSRLVLGLTRSTSFSSRFEKT